MLRDLVKFAYKRVWRHALDKRRYAQARFDSSVQWLVRGRVELHEGIHLGTNSVARVDSESTLRIGRGVWIGNDCEISAGNNMTIGERTSFQHRTQLHGDIQVGAGCVGAANLYVSSRGHEFRRSPELPIRVQDRLRLQEGSLVGSRPVVIGDDCWIGINVAIMPGVRIGRGCIVGANSVVTHDLPPYSISAGMPAKPIGRRLAFEPPRQITAEQDRHLPYFYAGFRQLGRAENEDHSVLRMRGGFVAAQDFCLALCATADDRLELDIDATAPGVAVHEGIRVAFDSGRSTIAFGRVKCVDSLICLQHSGSAENALVVLAARLSAIRSDAASASDGRPDRP